MTLSLAMRLAVLLPVFGAGALQAQSRVTIDAGQSSGGLAELGIYYWVVVHNHTGTHQNVRYYNKDWKYSGTNWIWYYPDTSHLANYWSQNPELADWRISTSWNRDTNPSQSFSAPAGVDGKLNGYWSTQFHFQLSGLNSTPSSTSYNFKAINEKAPVDFEHSFTMVLEVFQGGQWKHVGEKLVSVKRNLDVRLVGGGTFGNFSGVPVIVEFDLFDNAKPEPKPPSVCGIPGSASNVMKSVDLSFKLGGDRFGEDPATLGLPLGRIDGGVYDPRFLSVSGTAKFAKVCDTAATGHPLKQIQTQNDVVVVDDSSATDEQFALRFFTRDPSWTQPLGTIVDVGAITPHTTVTIANPVAGLTSHNKLRVTRVSGPKTETWDYTYIDANNWELVSEEGTRKETLAYGATADPLITTETRTLLDVTHNVLLSKVVTSWKVFSFGRAPISKVVDPDGKALTTTWDYYTNSSALSSYGQVQRQVDPSGSWTEFTYDSRVPKVVKSVQGYQDAPLGTPETQCRVKTRTLNVSGGPSGAGMTLETEKINNITVSRKFIVEYADGVDEIQCLSDAAAWNDAANLVTQTRYWSDPVFKTKIKSVLRPDGTGTFYSYKFDAADLSNASALTTIVTEGEPGVAALDVTGPVDPLHPENGVQSLNGRQPIKGTRTTTVTSRLSGPVLTSATHPLWMKVEDIESGKSLDERQAAGIDGFGRLTEEHFLDGTVETTTYGCCGIDSKTDRHGVLTTYSDLTASHTRTRSALGLTWKTRTSGLDVFESRVGSDNTEIPLSHSQFSVTGQLVGKSSTTGASATYDSIVNVSGLTVETTTYADGGTKIETLHRDGSLQSVMGSAMAPVRYEYGVEADGKQWIKAIALDHSGADTQEWSKTWQDTAGRVFKEERSGAGATTTYFNTAGQIGKVVDADGVSVLYEYDSRGRVHRSALDMNRNDLMDDGGTDRIVQFDTAIATRADGSPSGRTVERRTQTVWTKDNDAGTTAVIGTTDRAVDGLDSWVTIGGVTTQSHMVNSGNGAWTKTIFKADNSTMVRSYNAGRLASEIWKDSNGVPLSSASYSYDSQGRLSDVTDGRNATTHLDYYGTDDRLFRVSGPLPGNGGLATVTTIEEYDGMNRQKTIRDAANGTVTYTYWPNGAIQSIGGTRNYPMSYTYTAQGRLETMTTATGGTTWTYDALTGLLLQKLDAAGKGSVYGYTLAGRPATKINARGTTATYLRNNAGDVISVTYDDGMTSPANLAYNRLGHLTSSTSGGVSRVLESNPWGQNETETFAGGPLTGLAIARHYDSLRRLDGLGATLDAAVLTSEGYSYDEASRLKVVTHGDYAALYGYNSTAGELIDSVTIKQGGSTRVTGSRHYDLAGRLDWVKTLNAASVELFRADYSYAGLEGALDRRTGVSREDGTQWEWGYNDRGELTSGGKKFSDGAPHPVLQYSYEFDGIGNRILSKRGGNDVAHTSNYAPNSLNQYNSRTVPPLFAITGEADPDANVVVQAKPATRKESAFWLEWSRDNSNAAVRENVRVAAAKSGVGANGADVANLQTGKIYLPPASESFSYDDDGNLTGDSRWTYTWDAENRLTSMEEKPALLPAGWTRLRLEFSYDADGRRTRKKVRQWNGSAWQTSTDTAFVYDGWNLIAELALLQTPSPALRASHCWGLDLSGSTQGAGGVGGLLWSTTHEPVLITHLPAYDGNGNIIGWVDGTSGSSVIKLDYDPFGGVVTAAAIGDAAASSAVARAIPFRFSTKYWDRETGLDYYGYRYYSSELGRWMNRDPVGESGGNNVYGSCNNNLPNQIDYLGNFGVVGHLYATFANMVAQGMVPDSAFALAYYTQLPDQFPALDAADLWKAEHRLKNRQELQAYVGNQDLSSWSSEVQNWLHSLHGGTPTEVDHRRKCLTELLKNPSLALWERGFINHALGDAFAHTNPETGVQYGHETNGHLSDSAAGKDPDLIGNEPSRFLGYIAAQTKALSPTISASRMGFRNQAGLQARSGKDSRKIAQLGNWPLLLQPTPNWHIFGYAYEKYVLPDHANDNAFGRSATAADRAQLPKRLADYDPSQPHSRLDDLFPVPTSDQVRKLIQKMKDRCLCGMKSQ